MSKKLVSLSGEQTMASLFMQSIIIALKLKSGDHIEVVIAQMFPLCMESNNLEKAMKNCVALRFSARTPSMILRIVKIIIT